MHDSNVLSVALNVMQDVITQPWWVIVFICIGILALLLCFIILICKVCAVIRGIIYKNKAGDAPQWPTDLIMDFTNDFDFDLTNVENMSNFSPQFEADLGFIYESDGLVYESEDAQAQDHDIPPNPKKFNISLDTTMNNETTEDIVIELQPITLQHYRSGGRDAPNTSMNLKNASSHIQMQSQSHLEVSMVTGFHAPPSSSCTSPKPEQMGGLSLLREIEQILADRAIQDLKRESTNLQSQLGGGGGGDIDISLFRDGSLASIDLLSSGDNDDDMDEDNSEEDSSDDSGGVSSISDIGIGAGGDPFTLTKEIENALASMIN